MAAERNDRKSVKTRRKAPTKLPPPTREGPSPAPLFHGRTVVGAGIVHLPALTTCELFSF